MTYYVSGRTLNWLYFSLKDTWQTHATGRKLDPGSSS